MKSKRICDVAIQSSKSYHEGSRREGGQSIVYGLDDEHQTKVAEKAEAAV